MFWTYCVNKCLDTTYIDSVRPQPSEKDIFRSFIKPETPHMANNTNKSQHRVFVGVRYGFTHPHTLTQGCVDINTYDLKLKVY